MSSKGRKKPPLVAEKRYAQSAAAAKKPAAKPVAKKKPAPRRKPTRKSSRIGGFFRGILRWTLRVFWRISWMSAAVVGLIVAVSVFFFYTTLPPAADLLDGRTRGSVTLLDRDGKVFAWRGDQFGGQITASTVSPHLKNAVIATEDKRFYKHLGISPRGIAGAIRINLREGRGPLSGNGGSTITQQTAKLLCIGRKFSPKSGLTEAQFESECREGSLWRKIKEMTYALAMEAKYSKDDVLTIYLNRVYLGAGARGFEAAAQRYFGKSAAEVNVQESAMLAGLLKAPSFYAPTANLERAQDRGEVILALMQDQGYVTKAEADAARANPAQLSDAAEARAGGYFADWVMDSGPGFLTRDTTEDVMIGTTFDPRIQTAAEKALQYVFDEKVSEGSKAQAAIIVMSSDGAVRAMVGGRKTQVSGAFNRATQALRQTGSAFKPFVYAAALDLGYNYNDTVIDEPYTIDIPGSGLWSPTNYTKRFEGRVTLTQALKDSLNIPAVKISESVGRENVRKIAEDFGIQSNLADGPALALGASESTLVEMTGAYAGILNGGRSVRPYGLVELRLLGEDSVLMGQEGGMGERVISTNAAQQLIYMMSEVLNGGTGSRAQLKDREAAGKTGTTQAARDAWFIGFSADYVAGVWMGYDDNTPLKGVTGGGLPAEIWRETMERVHEGIPPHPLPMITPAQAIPQPQVAQNPQQNQRKKKKRKPDQNVAERILIDVLRGILGGGN